MLKMGSIKQSIGMVYGIAFTIKMSKKGNTRLMVISII